MDIGVGMVGQGKNGSVVYGKEVYVRGLDVWSEGGGLGKVVRRLFRVKERRGGGGKWSGVRLKVIGKKENGFLSGIEMRGIDGEGEDGAGEGEGLGDVLPPEDAEGPPLNKPGMVSSQEFHTEGHEGDRPTSSTDFHTESHEGYRPIPPSGEKEEASGKGPYVVSTENE